jgi:hypothetical protein
VTVLDVANTEQLFLYYHVTVDDNAAGDSLFDYPHVQPSSNSAPNTWCTTVNSATACNYLSPFGDSAIWWRDAYCNQLWNLDEVL